MAEVDTRPPCGERRIGAADGTCRFQSGSRRGAFTAWADANKVRNASLVLVVDGVILGRLDRGKYRTSEPQPIASDSKLVTGLCVLRAVESGLLSFSANLGDLLPEIAKHAADPRAKSITVSQLLTQSSGITYDASQGTSLNQFAPFTKPSAGAQVAVTLAHPLGGPPGTGYSYNNMNYALLGLAIEAATKASYAEWCAAHVLAPVGITDANINPAWMVMGAYGAGGSLLRITPGCSATSRRRARCCGSCRPSGRDFPLAAACPTALAP